MQKIISYKEVEDLIFNNQQIHKLLPHHKSLFDSYILSKISPTLANLGQRSVLKFMENVTKDDCNAISDILGYNINILPLDTNLVKNIICDIENIEFNLSDVSNYAEIVAYRKGNEVKILCWK